MDSTLACLAAWMPRQRWYAAKGRLPSLRLVAWWDLPAENCLVRTYLVADEGALPAVLYQIPIVARATETVETPGDHEIGSPEPGTTFIDGPFDPAYTDALFRLIVLGGEAHGPRTTATGRPTASIDIDEPRTAEVLSGEQSNTSLIYRPSAGGIPVICKIFRQLQPGFNPDIELTTALAEAGSPHVPHAIGAIEATWPDLATAHGTVSGSLAFAQEFLPGVEDAWRVALHAAAEGEDFGDRAQALGAATADVHRMLAALFPTHEARPGDRDAMAIVWRRRLAIATAEVPELADRRQAIEDAYTRAAQVPWPAFQRIHGDLHLGQVLHDRERGWMLVDFEGEPLRPMSERTRPDLALRDVAGMLRSFDYVAGSIRLDQPERSLDDVQSWAEAARGAFADGYSRAGGVDLAQQRILLTALEIDKAVYEATYESRNRPTWVAIPLRAIARLVDRTAAAA